MVLDEYGNKCLYKINMKIVITSFDVLTHEKILRKICKQFLISICVGLVQNIEFKIDIRNHELLLKMLVQLVLLNLNRQVQ